MRRLLVPSCTAILTLTVTAVSQEKGNLQSRPELRIYNPHPYSVGLWFESHKDRNNWVTFEGKESLLVLRETTVQAKLPHPGTYRVVMKSRSGVNQEMGDYSFGARNQPLIVKKLLLHGEWKPRMPKKIDTLFHLVEEPRTQWVYGQDKSPGRFVQLPDNDWRQVTSRNLNLLFKETARTDAYVELYHAGQQRHVRLFDDHSEWWDGQRRQWNQWLKGNWE